ncbi:MAG: GntR family transcriptional regulator, transcriptional repressor for pyruvate dehydrogenase complex [Pseudonocardiales bacterium]|jgi:DNA-binding FadR family transcriptional regulator|uniref:FadR/GntR family transcriptional regulator n=1 Tax=Pseudonocardia sp. TaxID=60912 RepID=UPI002607D6E8|nr:FadR/GntR family transcriptional regulator [Pseudonocardia sp.]MCW2718526.1 GntR domain protein [Pseudonocardia sp.]MDT7617998.1 GntR family transcriptional regulator, transcriptional repressor for pyruvate dehydrogenase complex [Pseudonocardiales bacterium]MDT7704747.1 GntR family transcriptional regulator, transcriptional repressor for pyruvate dehydrogenase complex [Pseudonocardiales bacterium]
MRTGAEDSNRRSPKISEVIARELASHIVNAKLSAGSVLPTEREMIESFDVGRSTIREALRLLETRNVITLRPGPGGGPVVRRPRPEDLSEALSLILQFEDASLDNVMEARRALEPTIARLAATRISDADLDAMDRTVCLILENPRPDVFQEQNRIFHATLSRAARSVVLQVFVESLGSVADGVAGGVTYSARRYIAAAQAHARIIEALRAHDAAQAEQLMRDHLDEADDYWHKKHKDLVSRPVVWRR